VVYETRGKLAVLKNLDRNVLIAGDIHGDFRAFEAVRKIFEREKDAVLIFLGDYADRGESGLEVIRGVREMLENHPGRVAALKGNHEDYRNGAPYFAPWTLGEEVREKLGVPWGRFYRDFERNFLSNLRLAFLVPGVALCVHGGISSRLKRVKQLESPDATLEEEILWSDPGYQGGEPPNPRGAGVLFGPDITERVVGEIGIRFIIRGHEPRKALDGPALEHGGSVVTTSCTSVYGGRPFVLRIDPRRCSQDLSGKTIFL
jgi:hypothetical protein